MPQNCGHHGISPCLYLVNILHRNLIDTCNVLWAMLLTVGFICADRRLQDRRNASQQTYSPLSREPNSESRSSANASIKRGTSQAESSPKLSGKACFDQSVACHFSYSDQGSHDVLLMGIQRYYGYNILDILRMIM